MNDPHLNNIHKISLKCIKDLNMRAEAIKLLEENLVVNSLLSVLPITFLDLIPKVESIKAKINMWDDIKLKKKKSVQNKGNHQQNAKQHKELEEYLQITS